MHFTLQLFLIIRVSIYSKPPPFLDCLVLTVTSKFLIECSNFDHMIVIVVVEDIIQFIAPLAASSLRQVVVEDK